MKKDYQKELLENQLLKNLHLFNLSQKQQVKKMNFLKVKNLEFLKKNLINKMEDIPHVLSSILLQKNSQYKIGFWCIEEIGEKLVFSVMHNSELTLIDVNYFSKIVARLVSECDDFEQMIEQMM